MEQVQLMETMEEEIRELDHGGDTGAGAGMLFESGSAAPTLVHEHPASPLLATTLEAQTGSQSATALHVEQPELAAAPPPLKKSNAFALLGAKPASAFESKEAAASVTKANAKEAAAAKKKALKEAAAALRSVDATQGPAGARCSTATLKKRKLDKATEGEEEPQPVSKKGKGKGKAKATAAAAAAQATATVDPAD